jgi:antitoxin (DNA-binding transcriptional repressor) of toxin-antitoxin stability system
MKRNVTVTEVLRNFADYINRVVYRGERFVLVRGGRPVAELSPIPAGGRLGDLPALLASLPHLSPGDADDLAKELDEARRSLDAVPPEDPWAS